MSLNSLSHVLKEWTEVDEAAFHVAVALDILPPLANEKEIYNFGGNTKYIFWTKNPIGDMLFGLLKQLVKLNILEQQGSDDGFYRWNSDFDIHTLKE